MEEHLVRNLEGIRRKSVLVMRYKQFVYNHNIFNCILSEHFPFSKLLCMNIKSKSIIVLLPSHTVCCSQSQR